MRRTVDGENRGYCCYGCCIADLVRSGSGEESEAAWLLIRLGIGGFLSMNIMLFSLLIYSGAFTGADAHVLRWIDLLLFAFATPALLILGGPFLHDAWNQAREGRLTASALIILGVGVAYAYSTVIAFQYGTQVYFDTATMVLMLFTCGRYLEAAGRARAARDLGPLLAAESEWANVVEGGNERRLSAREIVPGMLVRVMPGERIPVDGTVVEGASDANEAVMTGESRSVAKQAGASVIAGSMNGEGVLLIRCTGAGAATRWAQLCRSVRTALQHRAPTRRIADHLLGLFVPAVLALSLATVWFWWRQLPFERSMLNGIAVLVVACPCAVGLAAPLATSLGIARLARLGCVVRSPAALEALARASVMAFDKTGTLTTGRPNLIAIETDGTSAELVLARVSGLERRSEHTLARAILAAAAARGIAPTAVAALRNMPGRGVSGRIEGEAAAAGNGEWMAELGCAAPREVTAAARKLETAGHSLVYVCWGGVVHAVLALDDTPLPEARSTIAALRAGGLSVVLVTGDHAAAARRVAQAVGLDDWKADLSPEAKKALLDRCRRHHDGIAMVGDGLNDGPVLAAADIGIAVGNATDLARETADLVLPEGGLWMLPWIIGLARTVHCTILTNLAWAFGYNLIGLGLAASGYLQPVLAALVMAGSSLLVVMNSMRLERLPDPDRRALGTLPMRSTIDRVAFGFSAAIARVLPLHSDRALPDS